MHFIPPGIYALLIISFLISFGLISSENEASSGGVILLTIESAVARALSDNRQLLNTTEGSVNSEYQIEIAQSDFEWDIVPDADVGYIGGGSVGNGTAAGVGVGFSRKFTTGTSVSISPSVKKANNRWHTDINALISQPLIKGWGTEYTLSGLIGAEFSRRSSVRSLYTAQVQLVIRTVTALYEIIKAKNGVVVNRESYERIEKFYHAAKVKERIGLFDSLDTYRAEIELRHAEEGLTLSEEKFEDAEDVLRDILALPLDIPLKIEIPIVYTPPTISSNEAVELAMNNRIEIDQSFDQLRDDERLSRNAKKNLLPELNLVLNYSNYGCDQVFTETCRRKRESSWGIGFTTSSDFNPVNERIAYEKSLMTVESSRRNIEQTKANLTLEVKRVLRHLERMKESIELQAQQIKTAEGELKLSKIKFDRGMANNFDVIQAEKTFRKAQLSYWTALIDHIIGEYQLMAAVGLLMEKPCF